VKPQVKTGYKATLVIENPIRFLPNPVEKTHDILSPFPDFT
jgi:hypothetical protein